MQRAVGMAQQTTHTRGTAGGHDEPIGKVLEAEHTELLRLLHQLTEGDSEAGSQRARLYPELRKRLLAYHEAKRSAVYADLTADGRTRELASRGLGQLEGLQGLLRELDALGYDVPQWRRHIEALQRDFQDHVHAEQRELIPMAEQRVWTVPRAQQVADAYRRCLAEQLKHLETTGQTDEHFEGREEQPKLL